MAVETRTTPLLVRYRYQMVLPGRHGDIPLIAEDARVLGFEGVPAQALWLDDARATEVLGARPDEDTALELAKSKVSQILAGLDAALPEVNRRGEEFAAELREAHRRVRRTVDQGVRGLRVTVAGDADILGCYVDLPWSQEDAWDGDDLWAAADAGTADRDVADAEAGH